MDFQPPSSSGSKVVMDMGICPGVRPGNYIAILPYNIIRKASTLQCLQNSIYGLNLKKVDIAANKVTWGMHYVVSITIFKSEIFFYSKYFPLLCVLPGSAQAHRNYLGLSVVPIQHYNLLQSVEYFGTIMDC